MTEIRQASPTDGDAVLELVRALADYEKLAPPSPEAATRFLDHAFGDPPHCQVWVASASADAPGPKALAAYAVTFHTYSTFRGLPSLYLEDLFVHPDFRRRGVGTAIIRHLQRHAVDSGCGRFEWSVLDWNHSAIEFYAGLGADVVPGWRLCRMDLPDPAR